MPFCNVSNLLIGPKDTLRKAMKGINDGSCGIALVVDEDQRLLGTITDGDVRRALLAGDGLDSSINHILKYKTDAEYAQPVTAPDGTQVAELISLMTMHNVHQVPLIDARGRVVDLATLDGLVPNPSLDLTAVVMAGGAGTRLRPLTEGIPKPMLPVGDKPLMERIIEQLKTAGIHRVNITTHYKPEVIIEHFGDGQRFGVQITYVNEHKPLGTAGGLGLMQSNDPLLVINGDILTNLDYRAMMSFHRHNNADMTVGVRPYEFQVPYGVVETDGVHIRQLKEKPTVRYFINAGLYLLQPEMHRYIPKDERFDMTDLIDQLLAHDKRVVSFPIAEYWLDVGQHLDYEQAQKDITVRGFAN